MKSVQYTIRGVSPQLDAKLRSKAIREKKSLNKLLLEELSSMAEPKSRQQPHGDYSDLAGKWVDDPGFDEAMKDMRVVDPRDWGLLAVSLVLDTNAYSDFSRGSEAVVAAINAADSVYLPVIVLGELKRGFYNGSKIEANLENLQRFLDKPRTRVLDITAETAEQYGRLSTYLKQQGTPIPINDIWIAALCVQYDLPLLSRDRDFASLPQISLLTI